MEDPVPENIMGEKRVTHSVEHRINWGHMVLGVAVLAVVWFAATHLAPDRDESEEESVDVLDVQMVES